MAEPSPPGRSTAARVAKWLVEKNRRDEAVCLLAAWAASGPNDSEGQQLLAEALRIDPRSDCARMAFERMEGVSGEHAALDAAVAKWSEAELGRLDKEIARPSFRKAQVGFNNNLKYKAAHFHVQTEDSGLDRPHVMTHLFADGGRIIKSYKRSYAESVSRPDVALFVRQLMKGQQMEMILNLRDGKFDGILAGRESGGTEVFEHPPDIDVRRLAGKKKPSQPAMAAVVLPGSPGTRPPGGASADPRPAGAASADPRPAGAASADPRPAGAASADPRPAGAALADPRPAGAALADPRPAGAASTGRGPADAASTDPARGASSPAAAPAPTPATKESTPAPPSIGPRFRLQVLRSLSGGPELYEPIGDEVVIGSSGQVTLQGEVFCHPREAVVRASGERLVLSDIEGGNGVFLRIRRPVELEYGDEFIVGDQLLRIQENPVFEDGPDPTPTYFWSSPKSVSSFRVVQIFEGGAEGACIMARGTTVQIGSAFGEMVFPHDPLISELHCGVDEQAGMIVLTDLGSRTGVFVRIEGEQELVHGDELLVGRTRLLVDTRTAEER
ncbi:MAG: FHA domain-containing protein [Polyangiaceae bacterium]